MFSSIFFFSIKWWVTIVCVVTIGLWCVAHEIQDVVGDMGVIAIFPIVAFFSTGVLKKVLCYKPFLSGLTPIFLWDLG